MLERSEARHGVERAKARPVDLTRVLEVDLEPVPATGPQLRRGERHPHRHATARLGIREQRTPPATQVEQSPPRPDPDLVGHVIVLAPLRLLELEREVPVEHRAAEIGQLTEAEPNNPVSQRVREVGVPAVRHPPPTYAPRSAGPEDDAHDQRETADAPARSRTTSAKRDARAESCAFTTTGSRGASCRSV